MEQANYIQHILLADDDKDHAALFARIIKKEYPSVNLSHVADGQQLIQFLHLHQTDLLFLDLNMPAKNGYQVLKYFTYSRKDPTSSKNFISRLLNRELKLGSNITFITKMKS